MRKKTSEKLLKCVDDILSSLEMVRNFKGNSYISAKINKSVQRQHGCFGKKFR